MITLEQVEKLREKADVSYEDAKAALEASDGDMLEAVIYLEKKGLIQGPKVQSFNTQTGGRQEDWDRAYHHREQFMHRKRRFHRQMGGLWQSICAFIRKTNANQFQIFRDGECLVNVPVTLLIVAMLCFFWVTIPLLIIGLFFGMQYRFHGPDFGKEAVNHFMDQAADTAENIKRAMMQQEADKDEDTSGAYEDIDDSDDAGV
ncbi:MAG: DUF4342 domain-containing protein [Clostridiales bacterium]|nr:DUF4342 domain-containing protein [Clostridiales bacterium]